MAGNVNIVTPEEKRHREVMAVLNRISDSLEVLILQNTELPDGTFNRTQHYLDRLHNDQAREEAIQHDRVGGGCRPSSR